MTVVAGVAVEGPEKLLTLEQATLLLPDIESTLQEMDDLDSRQRDIKELIDDQETYWGEAVEDPTNPEYEKYLVLQSELRELAASLHDCVVRIHSLGGHLKSHELGLVDFYSVREGRTVFLCWQRGEKEIEFFHELEAGFRGRRHISSGD